VTLCGPPGTIYQDGFFQAVLEFTDTYPQNPPRMRFTSEMWHPNSILLIFVYFVFVVYPDGLVCISILHPPGEDAMSGETSAERWRPINTAESVLVSVLSLLSDPNGDVYFVFFLFIFLAESCKC
jgi:ubiquitin-conjugating enzyme E2 G1